MQHQKVPAADTHAFHAAERRINLNTAICMIDRGNIARASVILQDLIDSGARIAGSTPSGVLPFAAGYLGLCDHLSGSMERAIAAYEKAIKEFNERRRLRPVAIFNRLLADALSYVGETDEALKRVQLAIDAASHAEQRDVQHEGLPQPGPVAW